MSDQGTAGSAGQEVADTFDFRIKTDNLRQLRPLVDWAAAQTNAIDRLPRIYLVMDANTVRRELGFRLRRKKPDARTDLDDVLASGIATVFAPPLLLEEVDRHLENWARQLKVPLSRLLAEWNAYREAIVFCRDAPVTTESARRLGDRDPKDLPYVYLQSNLSAEAILTLDKDISETGSPTADAAVLVDLRDYAREKSVLVTIATGSVAGMSLLVRALLALGRLLIRSVVGMLLSLAAGAVLWVLHRREQATVGTSAFTRAWVLFREFVKKLLRTMERAHTRATFKWRRIIQLFSKVKRRTLRQFVFAVCAIARRALTTAEIVERVLCGGTSHSGQELPVAGASLSAIRSAICSNAAGLATAAMGSSRMSIYSGQRRAPRASIPISTKMSERRC